MIVCSRGCHVPGNCTTVKIIELAYHIEGWLEKTWTNLKRIFIMKKSENTLVLMGEFQRGVTGGLIFTKSFETRKQVYEMSLFPLFKQNQWLFLKTYFCGKMLKMP